MAKDIAQRELDQGGFKIGNLGNPVTVGDATKTDNTSMPKPAAGGGAPGASFLAAPADHVHPAAPGQQPFIRLSDPTLQSVVTADSSTSEVLFADVVNFDLLGGTQFTVAVSAEMQRIVASGTSGVLEVRLDGDPVNGGVGETIAVLTTEDDAFTRKETTSTPRPKPTGRHRITLTGVLALLVREKELVFTGVA
jgi:hypothetical protein